MTPEAVGKSCRGCKAVKSTQEFHRNHSYADGLEPSCKTCRSAVDALRRQRLAEERRLQVFLAAFLFDLGCWILMRRCLQKLLNRLCLWSRVACGLELEVFWIMILVWVLHQSAAAATNLICSSQHTTIVPITSSISASAALVQGSRPWSN